MRPTLLLTRVLMRASILILLILGILFWTGHALALVRMHMVFGLILVLGLWTLAGLAASRGAPPGLLLAALILGTVVLVLGMTQARLLPGGMHWVIQVLHLLLGMAVMGFGERIAGRVAASLSLPAAGA